MSCAALVLFVLLAGFVLYFTQLFRIAFGSARQKPSKPSAGLSLSYALTDDMEDCDYDLLWDTQRPVLEFLNSAGSSGASIAQVTKLYRESARLYPEIFDGSTLSDWLDALQRAEVVVRQGAAIAITEKGRFILDDLGRRPVIQGLQAQLNR